jgi:hypothetical protein
MRTFSEINGDDNQNYAVSKGVTEIVNSVIITQETCFRGSDRAMFVDGVYIPQCKLVFKDDQCLAINSPHTTTTEFEDIEFSGTCKESCFSIFLQNGNLIFRRCLFKLSKLGIICDYNADDFEYSLIFENCIFEAFNEYAVVIKAPYAATFLYCTFRDNRIGILVSSQGQIQVTSCIFQNQNNSGIRTQNATSVHINDCVMDKCISFGISIEICKHVVINRTKISHCKGAGIYIDNKVIANISFCTIMHSLYGIVFCYGKSQTKVINSTVSCNKYGVVISDLALGCISLNDNTITMNTGADLDNLSCEACLVTVNGTVCPRNRFRSEEAHAWISALNPKKGEQAPEILGVQRTLKEMGKAEHAPECKKCKIK